SGSRCGRSIERTIYRRYWPSLHCQHRHAVHRSWAQTCTPASIIITTFRLSSTQHACRVVEQFINRHAARYELLLVAEVDDDFQNRPAGLDAKSVRIELAAVRQTSGLFACVQLTEDVFEDVGARARQLLPDHHHVVDGNAVMAFGPAGSDRVGIGYEVLEFRVRQFVADDSGGDFTIEEHLRQFLAL